MGGENEAVIHWMPLLRAHPRVGGENAINSLGAGIAEGSSPRGRGKRYLSSNGDHRPGLIPAWAGKTSRHPPTPGPDAAHPRVGGENISGLFIDAAAKGSSPRGRGKLERLAVFFDGGGLIPAWAGKTE